LLHGAPRPAEGGKHPVTHFCAGGDIRFMHDAALAPDGHPNSPAYGHLKLPHLN